MVTVPARWFPTRIPFTKRPLPRRKSTVAAQLSARKSLSAGAGGAAGGEREGEAEAVEIGEGEMRAEGLEEPYTEEELADSDLSGSLRLQRGQVLWLRGLTRLQTQMQAMQVVHAFRMNLDADSLTSLERRLSALPPSVAGPYAPLAARIRKQSHAAYSLSHVDSLVDRESKPLGQTPRSTNRQSHGKPTRTMSQFTQRTESFSSQPETPATPSGPPPPGSAGSTGATAPPPVPVRYTQPPHPQGYRTVIPPSTESAL